MLTKWWKLELTLATNFGSHAQMVTKFGGQILATKFGFVPDWYTMTFSFHPDPVNASILHVNVTMLLEARAISWAPPIVTSRGALYMP